MMYMGRLEDKGGLERFNTKTEGASSLSITKPRVRVEAEAQKHKMVGVPRSKGCLGNLQEEKKSRYKQERQK